MLSRAAVVLKLSKNSPELISSLPLVQITQSGSSLATAIPQAFVSTSAADQFRKPSPSVFSHLKSFWQYFETSSEEKGDDVESKAGERSRTAIKDAAAASIDLAANGSPANGVKSIAGLENDSLQGVSGVVQKFPSAKSNDLIQLLVELGSLFPSYKAVSGFRRAKMRTELSSARSCLTSLQSNLGGQMSAKAGLNILKGMAFLRYCPNETFAQNLIQAVHSDITSLEISGLVDFLQVLVMLDCKPSIEMSNVIGNVAMESVQKGLKRNIQEPLEVAHLIEAFAAIEHVHQGFLDAAGDYLHERIKGLSEECLSVAMQSFSKLRHRHNLFLDEAVKEYLERQPQSFTPKQLSAAVHSLAVLRQEDVMSEILMDVAALSAAKRINDFTPGELANLIWSYTRLLRYHGHVKVLDLLAKGLFSKVHELEGFPDQLLNLTEAVTGSDLESCPEQTKKILLSIEELACKDLGAMSAKTIGKMFVAFGNARHYSENFVSNGLNRLDDLSEDLRTADIVRVLHSCGILAHAPKESSLENWISLLQAGQSNLAPEQICKVIWSLAIFDALEPAVFDSMCKSLMDSTGPALQVTAMQCLLHAEMLLEITCKHNGGNPPKIPEPLRSTILQAWRDRMYFNRSVSSFQREVGLHLMKLSVPYEEEQLIEQGDFRVDFQIMAGGKKKVALECNGPRRFSSNPPFRVLGDTIVARRVLEGRGWTLLSISKHQWQELGCPGAKEVQIRKILSGLL